MVSIIIPTYNYAHYLKETLQSVLVQTYTDWECIVIDDGSKDNTSEIVNEFVKKDNRFLYIHQQNKGVSAARNLGIKTAKGDFIQFLDGDDLLQTDKIKSQIEIFNQQPAVDIVYNDVRFFDDGNSKLLRASLKNNKPDNWLPKFSAKGKTIVEAFSKINFLVMNSPLIKKSVFNKVGYFDEAMKALEDWDFWMRCALDNCFFHYNENENAFALVRSHHGSLSTETTLMNASHFLFLKHALYHKNISSKYQLILFIKYVELFWDSVLTKFYFSWSSILLSVLAILLLPLYLLIKIVRLLK
jgi:glycosyltransferase involved in cell wall biosynthesis